MEGLINTALSILGGSGATAFGAWLLFRGKKGDQKVEESKTEASATAAFLEGQVAFQEYVDKVVEKQVETATESLRAQLADFATKLEGVQKESHEMNDAFRHRETQLWLWNIKDRPGPMPELPQPILDRLGIGHLAALTTLRDSVPTTDA